MIALVAVLARCFAKLMICRFPPRTGSDADLVRTASVYSNDARLQQIDLAAPVHLAFDELELADLAFGLAV
jgi:hypothetical protein